MVTNTIIMSHPSSDSHPWVKYVKNGIFLREHYVSYDNYIYAIIFGAFLAIVVLGVWFVAVWEGGFDWQIKLSLASAFVICIIVMLLPLMVNGTMDIRVVHPDIYRVPTGITKDPYYYFSSYDNALKALHMVKNLGGK